VRAGDRAVLRVVNDSTYGAEDSGESGMRDGRDEKGRNDSRDETTARTNGATQHGEEFSEWMQRHAIGAPEEKRTLRWPPFG
jgi:hypothetical protein